MSNTIVTACNSSYLWGALLLIASIRLNHGRDPIQVWASQLTEEEQSLLGQFENVDVIATDYPCPHLVKPSALLNVSSEYATWIDSDCMFLGNLDSLLMPADQGLKIRFREKNENAQVFAGRYQKQDAVGDIPSGVLAQWCEDVQGQTQARYNRQCVSNYISLHRKHFPLIELWKKQLAKVLPKPGKPYDGKSTAYFMTDESVLSSILIFADYEPDISVYDLDQDPKRRLIHFGQHLKPWNTWRSRHLRHYSYVLETIGTLVQKGYALPEIPRSLNPNFKSLTYLESFFRTAWNEGRASGRFLYPLLARFALFARN